MIMNQGQFPTYKNLYPVQTTPTTSYVTEFALAAVIAEEGQERIVGVCRAITAPDRRRAELTIVLRDDWQGRGIGKIMVKKVVMVMHRHGVSRIEILLDSRNDKMKKLFMSLDYPYIYEESILDICDRMEIEIWPEKEGIIWQ